MAPEDRQECVGLVVGAALHEHFAVAMVEKRQYVQGSMADVLELLEALLHRLGLQVRGQAIEDLDPRTLVEEEQVGGRIAVERKEALHLGEEVRIGDLEKIARLVRLQPIALQNPMQRGLSRCRADLARIGAQPALGPAQRPPSAARQRAGLAIERHDAQLHLLRIQARASRTGSVAHPLRVFGTPKPAAHGRERTSERPDNALARNARIGQGEDCGSARQACALRARQRILMACIATPAASAAVSSRRRQTLPRINDDLLGFSVSTSSGRVSRIALKPRAADASARFGPTSTRRSAH